MNRTDIKTSFATVIKSRREKLRITQEELAERANLHRTYISDIERGTRNLSLENISKLARALELSISELFPLPGLPFAEESSGPPACLVEVLLVEDNPDDVDMTLHAFKEAHFTNQVHVVRDGAEAVDYLFGKGESNPGRSVMETPQLILLDLYLPKLSGLEVLRRIRGDKRTRALPVVVLTASQKSRDISECRRLGVESYIVKPVNFHNLSQATPQLNFSWALLKPSETKTRVLPAKVPG